MFEEGLEFVGGAGEQDDDLAEAVDGGVEELAGGAALWVLEDGGAFEDVGLLGVVGRHHHLARGEALVERGEDGGVAAKRDAECGGDGFAGEVVFGGAEAAGEEDDVGAGDRDAGGSGEVIEIVADDGLEGDLDAEIVELGGEEERVGVLPVRREHLGAGCDNFCLHRAVVPLPSLKARKCSFQMP